MMILYRHQAHELLNAAREGRLDLSSREITIALTLTGDIGGPCGYERKRRRGRIPSSTMNREPERRNENG